MREKCRGDDEIRGNDRHHCSRDGRTEESGFVGAFSGKRSSDREGGEIYLSHGHQQGSRCSFGGRREAIDGGINHVMHFRFAGTRARWSGTSNKRGVRWSERSVCARVGIILRRWKNSFLHAHVLFQYVRVGRDKYDEWGETSCWNKGRKC